MCDYIIDCFFNFYWDELGIEGVVDSVVIYDCFVDIVGVLVFKLIGRIVWFFWKLNIIVIIYIKGYLLWKKMRFMVGNIEYKFVK